MGLISVLAAALATFVLGSVWYMTLTKHWVEASGVTLDEKGKPVTPGHPALPFIICGIAQILIAGMMRHMFMMAGIDTAMKGLVSGLGVGAFFITAWMAFNYAYAGRPMKLTLIDGGYATIGCGVMGLVLGLFA